MAIDWYAQADDGSVWYFGEDCLQLRGRQGHRHRRNLGGRRQDTGRADHAGRSRTSGDVYRSGERPGGRVRGGARREGRQNVRRPERKHQRRNGSQRAAHGRYAGGEDLRPRIRRVLHRRARAATSRRCRSRRRPTSRPDPAPAEFGALSAAARGVFEAAADADAERAKQAAAALDQAWAAVLTKGIPPQMESQMNRDIGELNTAMDVRDWRAAQSAALRVAQNELDLRLLYQPVIDVDLARHGAVGTTSFRSTWRPTTRRWCWPMWRRWNVFGSALDTASNRPDRWTLRCRSSGGLPTGKTCRRSTALRSHCPKPSRVCTLADA